MVSKGNKTDQYRRVIEPFLEEWAERGLDDAQQFRNWSVQQVLWDYGLSMADVEDAASLDGPGDKGIDAWYYDETDIPPRLILVQAKNTRIEREDFSKLTDGFLDVMLPNRPGGANQTLRERAAAFREVMPSQFKLDVYLTSSVIAQPHMQPTGDDGSLYVEDLHIGTSLAEATYFVRDIKFMAENLQVIHRNPITCVFHVEKTSYFEFAVGGHTRTICAALKATELAKLFHDQRENLFRKNPRYYLMMSARNKEIKSSLQEPENEDFFVYNNGLTCIAESVRSDTLNDKESIITLSDFQIVNGCQTVASLWSVWTDGKPDITKVRVLAKIVENSRTGAAGDVMSTRIAVRSNTQNPIKAEDWKANDDRQERWQGLFRKLPEPWYYEIKRGVWASEHRSAQEKAPFRIGQTSQYRKVSMKDLAQACYAFIGHPAEALDKVREVFNSPALYDKVFDQELTVNQLLLPYLIWQEADNKARKETPVYTLSEPPEAQGFQIKTDYLRFPIVNAVGRMLSTLAGVTQGYLSAQDSEALIVNKDSWLPEFIDKAFERLANKLAVESRKSGLGPRSIVRRNDWMDEPISMAADLLREYLRMEAKFGQTGQGSVSAALPFEVH